VCAGRPFIEESRRCFCSHPKYIVSRYNLGLGFVHHMRVGLRRKMYWYQEFPPFFPCSMFLDAERNWFAATFIGKAGTWPLAV
jgi:hypothetical protein